MNIFVLMFPVIEVRKFWPQHIFYVLTASENIYGARAQHVVIIEVVANCNLIFQRNQK